MSRDAIVASALSDLVKPKGWRVVFGNRQLSAGLHKFEQFFDIVVLPRPHFLSSYFAGDSIKTLKSKYVILYTEQIGITTSVENPQLTLRKVLDEEFMSGDVRYVNKVEAFCLWSNQAKNIILRHYPELGPKCYIVGHPRHDLRANPSISSNRQTTRKNIGILTRSLLLNDYFGRQPLRSIYDSYNNIHLGGQLEYENVSSGERYISQVRGSNPKNDFFIEAIDFEIMLSIIEGFKDLDYNISLRLHPKEDRVLYDKIFGPGKPKLNIVPPELPFAHWVQSQRFIIGPPSTSFYDALLLGVLPISTCELNSERSKYVTSMYEDRNQLMASVYKPKNLTELINFILNVSDETYSSMSRDPRIIKVLEQEVNYPHQRESLSLFIGVLETLQVGIRSNLKKRLGVLAFRFIAGFYSELMFPYFLFRQKIFGLRLLNSAGFMMNFTNRRRIRRLIFDINE